MSSSVFNNISISVSDGESDDSSGKMRVHVRRKRKKLGFRWRILRKFARWWMILIFFPAVVVLFLQISIISVKQPKIESHLISHKESYENLDQIDARTRIVNGIREPCLKILKLEELQHLEFPMNDPPEIPVRRVIYRTNSDPSYDEAKGSFTQENIEASRFNLFTGFQTLAEREESFKVNETAMVHCGFYSKNGGYNISDDDQNYMNSCKSVVSTCAFGGGDDLYQPIGMSKTSLEKVCYVAFWDEITLSTQEVAGKRIGKDGMIGNWRIVIVKDLPFSDQRLNGKIPKMLSHRLFPNARYSIWIDSKSQFRRDPLGVWEALLWRTNSVLAISEHGARSNVYDEGKAVVKKHKATPEEVEAQLSQYRHDGFPDDKRFNGKKALSEASVIVREHTPLSNLFMCLWFNEVVRFTSRDQLSFPYVFRRLKQLKINMFPVCTRKDLVNSMGHQRKVKPLIKPTPTTNTSLR